jgi:mRNA-degrading endonuclease RelE of RelBE toxin-antitoxin system
MTRYTVRFTKAAAKQLGKASAELQRRLAAAIDGLSEKPRPEGAKKLTDSEDI